MNTVDQKLKKLKNYLFKQNIKFKKIEVSIFTTVHLETTYITSRSSYFPTHEDEGISPLVFHAIQDLIKEVNLAHELDKFSVRYEKAKLNSLLVRMDQTIKNSSLNVSFKTNKDFGGYTASRTSIVLYDASNETFDQYVKIVPGINYHELGHVLFTCSFRTLAKDVLKKYGEYIDGFDKYSKKQKESAVGTILRLVNLFEDGRMESLMGNKYGNVIPYFKDTFYNFPYLLIKEKVDNGEPICEMDCVLVAGRKYLDPKLRRWIFEKYMENNTEENAKRVSGYINKFLSYSWRKNRQEMLDLVFGFFFEFIKPQMDQDESEWEKMLKEMIQRAGTEMNKMSDDEIDESEEQVLKKLLQQAIEENEDSQEQAISDDEAEDLVDKDQKNATEQIKEKSKELTEKLKKTEIDLKKNDDFSIRKVTSEMLNEKLSLEKTLKMFMSKCRNGYRTRKKKGTVDIGEARRQEFRGGMRIFRQYKRNTQKALDVDVAFVLDCSYSMLEGYRQSKIEEAAKQLWIASKACETVGAKVKIFSFSDNHLGTLDPIKNTTHYKVPRVINGTTIGDTLYLAENYLNCSSANNKWLIVLTDGAIQDAKLHIQIIERMKNDKITCGKINISCGSFNIQQLSTLGYDHVLNIIHGRNQTVNSIVGFFRKIFEISLS
jgi:hypothetical protein